MAYTKTTWQDLPNTTTPINATNLNKIENGIEAIDNDVSAINNNIGDLTDLETSDTSSLVDAINTRVLKKIWENPNPTNNFNPQTLSFDASQYDYFVVVYKNTATSTINNSKFMIKNTRFSLDGINAGQLYARNTDTNGISNTGVTFGAGLYIGTYGTETQNNEFSIPVIIYGGKF